MNILFWIYKSRINKAGKSPIMMRITIDGERVSLATNVFVIPEFWDKDKQVIKGNDPVAKENNDTLLYFHSKALNHYNDCLRRDKDISAAGIRDMILKTDKPVHTLLEVFSYHISNLKARVGFDISVNTVKKYRTVETKLKVFLIKKISRTDINLSELNHKFITELDMYMKVDEGLKHNAVIKNMQQFKGVIRICMQNGWLEKDPFSNYKMALKDTERGYLTLQELKLMEEVSLPSERLDHVRDVFIFCCYTGLAFADVSKLNKAHFEQGEDGITWIKLNRTKSKTRSVIPLLPRAREILEKYSNRAQVNSEKKLLPVISNQNLNKYLKEIAVLCGIQKRVSMHLARHTFATSVTLGKGIDIMTVSKMLGHKNLRTTQIYSKVTELKIAEDMKKLM
jgi:site-specific recombinase XerD